MRSGNPVLSEKKFSPSMVIGERMTIEGVVNKSFAMLGLVVVSAWYVWDKFFTTMDMASVSPFIMFGVIGGLVAALVTVFKPTVARYSAPVYAVLEGLALGGISAFMESRYPGIVFQAVSLTFAVFFSLLFLYKTGRIKVTENFKMMVVSATGGIFLVYLLDFVLMFFGIRLPMIHEGGFFGILFSLVVVGIASMNLVLDFDFIEKGAERGAPQYMEWYGAFGLTVTLVWLYLEILRLLAKTRD